MSTFFDLDKGHIADCMWLDLASGQGHAITNSIISILGSCRV